MFSVELPTHATSFQRGVASLPRAHDRNRTRPAGSHDREVSEQSEKSAMDGWGERRSTSKSMTPADAARGEHGT